MRVELVAGSDATGWTFVVASGPETALPPWGSAALPEFRASLSREDSVIGLELEQLRQVKAVYVHRDEEGVLHVYTVVPQHESATYSQLIRAEERIRSSLPARSIHFHIRAHQGRQPGRAVPLASEPIFIR